MKWLLELVGLPIGKLAPYAIGALGVAVLAAGAAAYVMSLRLELAEASVARVEEERDSALSAVKATKAAGEAAAQAAAKRLNDEIIARAKSERALDEYRNTPRGDANACHFAVVDPSVDRLLAPASAHGSDPD